MSSLPALADQLRRRRNRLAQAVGTAQWLNQAAATGRMPTLDALQRTTAELAEDLRQVARDMGEIAEEIRAR
ncbi:hypothetical protein FZ103_00350 [Streptomonospora sp. PA3]|uniref:hypothetical protein n=1 Tax=Streptomonospora sp. PA3 TaxID=2607326 RepID=UPI0012DD418C|nr:hypothetical protein [Streptomonospora sp. PA3]MUL39644.1 hypothetical protein [Streptomonospora sp. PA3]